MQRGKEIRSNFFAGHHVTRYLDSSDKYLFARDEAKYKLNIIGFGMMGLEHALVTMLEGRADIYGVYDKSETSVQANVQTFQAMVPDHPLKVYSTLEDACNDEAVDGLVICTPNYTHLAVVREAVKSGKHILLEKPMATTLEDAIEITRLAKGYSGVFQIGLQYRFKSIYSEAAHEVKVRGAIGEVKTMSITEHRVPFLDKVEQWNKFAKYSGGTLVEKCCHYFDLLNFFAEARPKLVYASGNMAVNFVGFARDGEQSDILDNAMVVVQYENGIKASFNLCMFAPMFYEEMVLCGDEGRLKASENTDFLPDKRPETHLEILSGEHRPSRISTPCYPEAIQHSGHHGATYYEHKYFVDNIDGKSTVTAGVDEGLWSIIVATAADESIRTGNVVHVDEFLAKYAM
ncbi:Gfo/Idh/MocA family protein [Alicyclobacillus mengziensis]|uniref:Gfo/Idh/MocA family oxidoreductase n=1 Tax=Alicyclobacillus mengziensis TaxID=2931921 RepID=A0A9X7Z968_9BACL|nr:Gfo/Idh/MocA family oxidoreductase [Alicyclobacillus mengziensis]QSO49293.1 Gfo/Idh/MocA family oxidoreductase [Alicyclobacillus mengziensis]